ncbi:MAG TPA: thiopurine S-methyltransferase [Acidiferrobacterales bacterium]|nr:thiopurine S-methyltransferase [Acidiferrobacterales bacterium]
MQPEFWLSRWQQNQTGFHQEQVNPSLKKFLPELGWRKSDRVFVPLCGKSKDMLWLQEQGYAILGVEISPIAIEAFFKENGLKPICRTQGPFTIWQSSSIQILCGDFFDLAAKDMQGANAVYDRASLIAFPTAMRQRYAGYLASLMPATTHMLLITLEYPQAQMNGPPFSVDEQELRALYRGLYEIRLLDKNDILEQEPRFKEKGLTQLVEKTYLAVRC